MIRRIVLVLTVAAIMTAMLAVGAAPTIADKPEPPPVPQVAACGGLHVAHEFAVNEEATFPGAVGIMTAHESIPGEDQCMRG